MKTTAIIFFVITIFVGSMWKNSQNENEVLKYENELLRNNSELTMQMVHNLKDSLNTKAVTVYRNY